MKKILLSLIISGASVCSFAQTTMDFDNPPTGWTGTGASIEPTGWISENAVTALGNPQSVFQAITPDIHGGTYAMKIVSITMTMPIAGLPNPIGLAAPGQLVGFAPKFGYPYTARPASMSFWYKYTPAAGGDTAECAISIWNSVTKDTLATGVWKNWLTVGSYTQQTVTLIYNPAFSTQFPDSMGLTFSSTKLFNPNYSLCTSCGKAGSTLWVDDITFPGWNSVSETEMSKGVSVFPNPSSDFATITVEDVNDAYLVEVFDITGRAITSVPLSQSANGMNKKSATITTHGMSAGLYSLSVYDKNKHILRSGKLNVVK